MNSDQQPQEKENVPFMFAHEFYLLSVTFMDTILCTCNI